MPHPTLHLLQVTGPTGITQTLDAATLAQITAASGLQTNTAPQVQAAPTYTHTTVMAQPNTMSMAPTTYTTSYAPAYQTVSTAQASGSGTTGMSLPAGYTLLGTASAGQLQQLIGQVTHQQGGMQTMQMQQPGGMQQGGMQAVQMQQQQPQGGIQQGGMQQYGGGGYH